MGERIVMSRYGDMKLVQIVLNRKRNMKILIW